MQRVSLLFLIGGLVACSPAEQLAPEPDIPTVKELAADPARLKELRAQCKTDRTGVGDMLCDRVAEATRKRFYGDGTVPYTPSDTSPKF